jgi:hypothetical protein
MGFTMSLASLMLKIGMDAPPDTGFIRLQYEQGSILPNVRQALAETAMLERATHILWLDSDMVFPWDTLHRLMAHDLTIVGVNPTRRRPPYLPTVKALDGTRVYTSPESEGLEQVDGIGFGVLLIKTTVLGGMKKPWFDFTYRAKDGSWLGEDYYFMEKAKKAGHKVWCDHDLTKSIKHIGELECDYRLALHSKP